jgi:hypothetical protein
VVAARNACKTLVANPKEKEHSADLGVDGKIKKNSVASIRKRTIPTERPPLVSEVSGKIIVHEINV